MSVRLDGSDKGEPRLPANIPVSPVSSVWSGREVHRAEKVANDGDRERETQYLPEEGVFRMDPSDGDEEVSGDNGSLLWSFEENDCTLEFGPKRQHRPKIENSHFDVLKGSAYL